MNDDVRRCILSNCRAISCAIDDFPVPACPKRTRLRSEAGSFTQLLMKSRNATRVPIRQPLSGLNRELHPYGISLIFASSSMTTIRSVTRSHQRLITGVGNLACQVLKLSRYICHLVQNLEHSNLRRDGSLAQEGLLAFDKDIGQLLDFFL